MKNRIFNILIIASLVLTSCNKWLDVKPADKVIEDEMFESQKGYLSALNGVYIEMVSPSLYGSNLSAGMIDVMAQYYKVMGNNNHSQRLYANYNYTDADSKARIESIWVKNYSLLFNINSIIDKCNEDNGILKENIKKIILGESYALRAYLHFDLLRLFGPVFSTNAADLSIPYQTKTDLSIEPLLPARTVTDKIIGDLKNALEYLGEDPVITEGATYLPATDGSIDLSYRQYRLNYLAVKGLLARVCLWAGNNSDAYKYAKEVINHCHSGENKLFPFVSYEQATSTSVPDRIFSSEIIFGLYNSGRTDIHNSFFNSSLNSNSILTMFSERIESMFDDDNDFRKKFWVKESVNSEEVNIFRKFADVVSTDTQYNVMVRYMMPMIRMSELYLVAAECTDDIEEANRLINQLRNARNCISKTFDENSRMGVLTAEYAREFIGEGQMFYYYKRKGFLNLPNGGDPQVTFNMNLANYVMNLPDSEISQRNQ